MRALILIAIGVVSVALSAQDSSVPSARYQSGPVPSLPVLAIGGGEVLLEVSVASDGHVAGVTPLRDTPPFTELLTASVRAWRFRPVEDTATVMVVGLFRPPALNLPTLGEVPNETARASDRMAFPLVTTLPPFPPQANRSGVVLLETLVNRGGDVTDVKVLSSSPPFDEAARSAVGEWVFRPARAGGMPVAAYVYVVLGFAAPIATH